MTTREQPTALDTPIEGLHAGAPQPLPFDTSLAIRAFLLPRADGNLLVYSSETLEADRPALEELGGVSRQYLNHRHEAIFGAGIVDAPLITHEDERESVAERVVVAETFSERHTVGADFEAIPTPGHTPGATAYLWDGGEHRFLFTGDSLYLREGEWVAAVLGSSDRSAYIESLELIRELDFDVLVPWAATAGQPYLTLTGRAEAQRRLDPILERVRRGADH